MPPTFTSSMEVNQFVDNYVVKKTKFLAQDNKMLAPSFHVSHIYQFNSWIMSSYRNSFLFHCCHCRTCEIAHGCFAHLVCRCRKWTHHVYNHGLDSQGRAWHLSAILNGPNFHRIQHHWCYHMVGPFFWPSKITIQELAK